MYIDERRDTICLGNLLKNRPQGDITEKVNCLFNFQNGREILTCLGWNRKSAHNSRIVNADGDAGNEPFKSAASFLSRLTKEVFAETFRYFCKKWTNNYKKDWNKAYGLGGTEISPVDFCKILAGRIKDKALTDWIENALENGEKWIAEVMTVFTILAVTKNHWNNIMENLKASLPVINDFPHRSGYERLMDRLPAENASKPQQNLYECLALYNRCRAENTTTSLQAAATHLQASLPEECNKQWRAFVYEKSSAKLLALSDAVNENDPELRAHIRKLFADLFGEPVPKNLTMKKFAVKLLSDARKCLRESRRYEKDDFCLMALERWGVELSASILNLLSQDDNELIADYFPVDPNDEIYGQVCYLMFEAFKKLGNFRQAIYYLDEAVKSKNPQGMCYLMELLLPLDDEHKNLANLFSKEDTWSKDWNETFGNALAAQLSEMVEVPTRIKGVAYYQRYRYTADLNFLRKAYKFGDKRASAEYAESIISYRLNLASEQNTAKFTVIANVEEKNSNACIQIFSATLPDTEKLRYAPTPEKIDELTNTLNSSEPLFFLFVRSDSRRNLSDFLLVMENLKYRTLSCAIFVLCGSEQMLSPFVDTALKQRMTTDKDSFIRVKIIDEDKAAAENLLARRLPLYYPLLGRPDAKKLKLVVIGNGGSVRHLLSTTAWIASGLLEHVGVDIFLLSDSSDKLAQAIKPQLPKGMTLTPFAKNIQSVLSEDKADGFSQSVVQSLRAGDALFFVIDIDNESDLENVAVAIQIRQDLIRYHLTSSSANAEPPTVPIACRVEDLDIGFLAKRLKVLSLDSGAAWYNSYDITPYSGRECFANLFDEADQLALCAHLSWYGENQTAQAYKSAVDSFTCSLYNQSSSMAQILYTPYVLFELKDLDPTLLDEWHMGDEDFFSKRILTRLCEHDIISKLQKVNTVLSSVLDELNELKLTALRMMEELPPQAYRHATWRNLANELKNFGNILAHGLSLEKLSEARKRLINVHKQLVGSEVAVTDDEPELQANELFADKLRELFKKTLSAVGALHDKLNSEKSDGLPAAEHKRWSNFMMVNGWRSCGIEEIAKFIKSGQQNHQLHICKLHPALVTYARLENRSRDLEPYLGERLPFKQNDIAVVYGLGDVLSKRLLFSENETNKRVRRLFGLE